MPGQDDMPQLPEGINPVPANWAGRKYAIPVADDGPEPMLHPEKRAEEFLLDMGLNPNPDAVDQLLRAFVPALAIMCQRDHDANGRTWKRAGWKPQLHELQKKSDRLNERSWRGDRPDPDSATDMINYAGMLIRAWLDDLSKWGRWGEPG